MITPIIIALTGPAGSGKDTVADILVTHAGFTKLAFADALRKEVAAAYDMGDRAGILSDRRVKEIARPSLALQWCRDPAFIRAVCTANRWPFDTEVIQAPRSARSIMQWWGTEYRRAQYPDYWVSALGHTVGQLLEHGRQRIVVSDCRFLNEAAALRAVGGEVWRVLRPDLRPIDSQHTSETEGARITAEAGVVNDSTVVELAHQVLATLVQRHGGMVLPDDLVT